MNKEQAIGLQEHIAKEAIAILALLGSDADTTAFVEGITLIGRAWDLEPKTTDKWLDLIKQEKENLAAVTSPEQTQHVLAESELPMNACGMETLKNIWGLFESATALRDRQQREALFRLAEIIAETQNLTDWIEKTENENKLWLAES